MYLGPLVCVHPLAEQRLDGHLLASFCRFYKGGVDGALRVWSGHLRRNAKPKTSYNRRSASKQPDDTHMNR